MARLAKLAALVGALALALVLFVLVRQTWGGEVPEGVQASVLPNEAHPRADLVLTGTVQDRHTDRERLRALAGMLGAEAQVPVRWMEFELDVVASDPEGVRGRTVARLAYADEAFWIFAARELAAGGDRRFYVVRRDGVLWIVGWDRPEEPVPAQGPPPEWTGTRYFPAGAVFTNVWKDDGFHRWNARELELFHEPVLYTRAADPAAHVYRFIWLRSFGSNVVVRLEVRADGSGTVVFKESEEVGGPSTPQRGVRELHREVDARQVDSFLDALARSDFWRANNDYERAGEDGADWTCEAVRGGRYKVTFRWSPREGPYRRAMLRLVALAGAGVPDAY